MRRLIAIVCGIIVLAGLWSPLQADAAMPVSAYTYDLEFESLPAPNSYQTKLIIDGVILGCDKFSAAKDIFVDRYDQIYLLDSGNSRVVWIDENYELVKIIDRFTYNGENLTLSTGAEGIFYHDALECLYIADTDNDRILVCDLDGVVSRIYEKPESNLLDRNLAYKPAKVIVDNMGVMYVLSENVNTGAILADSENKFLGFYGVNAIKETWDVKVEYMWRSVLNEEQISQSTESFQPTGFNNLFWSEDRFVYGVSTVSDTIETPVVKLNATGVDVLNGEFFGDLGDTKNKTVPIFEDITVDDEGNFVVLDSVTGKLYWYDNEGGLLSAFGGKGTQKGLFTIPTSIEVNSRNELFVVDAGKNTITVLEQTFYGEMVKEALLLHNKGLYKEALEPWLEVLRMNANYTTAYIGIGKAYMNMKDYELAMEYFELGGDRENYAEAKAALRNQRLQENFAVIALAVVVIMLFILCYDGIKTQFKVFVGLVSVKKKGAA